MVGELITLPLRVGVRATQLWLRAAEETAAVVADVAGRLIGGVVSDQPAGGSTTRAEPERHAAHVEPHAPAAEWPVDPAEALTEVQPAHVSGEPELVEEIAEPGAEEGAGATLHVHEPWPGYDQMKADDVIDRLAGSSAAELAAIQLYESENKGRTTVLEAVERELRISTGSGSQS